jgi:transposase-like protein
MSRSAVAITLTTAERAELEGLASRRRTAQGLAGRARIVLAAAQGMENQVIAETVGADENTVGKWRRRFAERRIDGLYDQPRSGAPRQIGDDEIAETIRLTLETTPAAVLCVGEKSQIRALDRTQPLLPMRPGQAGRRTHDDTRHGTLSREFRALLNAVEANVPADLDVHIVMDNVSSHKTQAIRSWFAKRPRWQVHYTPTSASWINQVERFFANLTEKQIRRGVHRSTAELEAAIKHYIDTINADPKPFVWTKAAADILATIKRFCLATLKTATTQAIICKTSESGY